MHPDKQSPSFTIMWKVKLLTLLLAIVSPSPGYTSQAVFKRSNLFHFSGDHDILHEMSLTQCGVHCTSHETCAGFTCIGASESGLDTMCDRCYLLNPEDETRSSIAPISGVSPWSFMTFPNNMDINLSSNQFGFLHFPSGLQPGTAIRLRGNPGIDVEMLHFAIIDNAYFVADGNHGSELDIKLSVTFENTQHIASNSIIINNYDKTTDAWPGPRFMCPLGDFITRGEDMEWIVFVSDSVYSLFVDGYLLYHYPRPARYTLNHFQFVMFSSGLQTIEWFKAPALISLHT